MQPAEPVLRRANRVFTIPRAGDIAANEFAAGLIGGLPTARLVDISDEDLRPLLSETQGNGTADRGRAPGDERGLVFQAHGRVVPVRWSGCSLASDSIGDFGRF